ncbi:glucose 1-dehydrogenase [Denitrificimonas sp. JX-1]|uniref:Glucose 1-dehydrogenase n=1 Tax=Denitrificimonas halotolerans TaxID=3098930 RepID=A0ABU5GMD1_9GAMM|nr:glucose 1-dehydrogenase [Denitrificimonas sp. JX-1]MDY7218064.1 glucose 1-dehydrogenase [Denitrificimonas sp. JX-1]
MNLIERFSLANSVAIITGSGKGIGRAIAIAYAEAGAKVVCAARTLADVEAVAQEICSNGGDAIAVACDVTSENDRTALVQKAIDTFGKITHLVNNAGGGGPNDPLQMPWQEFDRLLNFNVTCPYHLMQLCVPHMREAGGGNILNITSVAARYVQPNFSSYGTAKAALVQLTKLLSQDFAPEIRVNAISPGPIMTDALNKVMPDQVKAIMTANTPLKRLGEVEDIAAAALYLASPASGWVSGKIIDIDGGADVSVFPS